MVVVVVVLSYRELLLSEKLFRKLYSRLGRLKGDFFGDIIFYSEFVSVVTEV